MDHNLFIQLSVNGHCFHKIPLGILNNVAMCGYTNISFETLLSIFKNLYPEVGLLHSMRILL